MEGQGRVWMERCVVCLGLYVGRCGLVRWQGVLLARVSWMCGKGLFDCDEGG